MRTTSELVHRVRRKMQRGMTASDGGSTAQRTALDQLWPWNFSSRVCARPALAPLHRVPVPRGPGAVLAGRRRRRPR